MVLTSTKITESLNRAPERYGYYKLTSTINKKMPEEDRKLLERLDLIETSVAYCNGAIKCADF